MLKARSGRTSKAPLLTFKNTQKSEELSEKEYNRVSGLQKDLWLFHTKNSEKHELWFTLFSPYHRTKLWNKLTFAEDYALNIANSKQMTRQDLVMHFLHKFIAIRGELLGVYELERQNLEVELVIFPD